MVKGAHMVDPLDDPDDPIVEEKDVPSFEIIARKIKDIDNSIIIFRIYYFFSRRAYKFQLIRKDRMCMFEISRELLENLGKDGTSSEQQISDMLTLNVDSEECWKRVES
ncbi:MAG: hypothetical protein JSV11_11255 [Nitrospiraceae bacterium]|jgi:hypothetical protein|nr:MAG: hypothetical protein JSV11_11255 [Nitrospiraceae bacterium]